MATKEQLLQAINAYQKAVVAMDQLLDLYQTPALRETPPFLLFMNTSTVATIKQLQECKTMYEIMLEHYDELNGMSDEEKGDFHIMKSFNERVPVHE